MTEHYRALDGQGLQPPPPTAVAASGQWRYVGPVHQPDTGTAYLYTYVDGGGNIRDRVVQRISHQATEDGTWYLDGKTALSVAWR